MNLLVNTLACTIFITLMIPQGKFNYDIYHLHIMTSSFYCNTVKNLSLLQEGHMSVTQVTDNLRKPMIMELHMNAEWKLELP